jgi:membrane carboxypeptidase/penicillin-binding protein PbpC
VPGERRGDLPNAHCREGATTWFIPGKSPIRVRFADQGFLGRTGAGESLAWHPSRAGRHTLRVIDDAGGADARDVSVEVGP